MTTKQANEIKDAGVLRQFEYTEQSGRRIRFYGFIEAANETHASFKHDGIGMQTYPLKHIELTGN